jgi:small subunit ribosomal protein S9
MTETRESVKLGVAIGRRKSSTARVRLLPGTGKLKVNQILGIEYFQNSTESIELCRLPLHIFDLAYTYDVEVQTFGGGLAGQIQAIKLGIARALVKFDISKRPKLKSLGLLQRDSRIKERKKYGLKKARKASQYSKR